jgi:DNA-binding winged helix-turn-helix (wHTH) protein
MSSNGLHGTLRFGPFELSSSQRVLRRDGVTLPLGNRAFDILVYLAERPGEVIGKKELIDHVWPNVTVAEGSLRVHVAAIRKVLGDGQFGNRYVTNDKGRGYCFIGSVVRLEDSTECIGDWPQQPGRRPERPPEKNQVQMLVLVLADRILVKEVGSEGYVTKPFALAELVARMEALLRRPPDMRETTLRTGNRKLRN